ncbi:MAG TPA: HD domain-containing protein [Anaerolineales bacterium]|nr:HD domain-containing protein [Anaerolineales bacterium]
MISVPSVLDLIRRQYVLPWDGLHGVTHWGRVLENGRRLAGETGADLDVLLLFCLFHDACRFNDGWDKGHGRRGADLAASLRGEAFDLEPRRFDRLYQACALHTDGLTEGDITLQTCWDADRLDLARASIFPRPDRLCTPAARRAEIIAWATERSLKRDVPSWLALEWGPQDRAV